ncbi:hypothetical protein MJO29_008420 [Puccinia striiformis f. sp. tritici]|nr:hypothetical protein MJO29_008420 [Puccinia striiformis f. sp. tritici]
MKLIPVLEIHWILSLGTFKVMVHHTSKSLILLLLTVVTASIAAPPIKVEQSPGDIGVLRDIGRFGESSAPGSGSVTPLRHQPETERPEPNVSAHDHNAQGDQDKLPIATHTNQNEDQEAAAQCAICLESLDNHQHGEVKKRTTCTHLFHEGCVSEWTKTQATCPLCREVDQSLPSFKEPSEPPSSIHEDNDLREVTDQARINLRRLEQSPPSDMVTAQQRRMTLALRLTEGFIH